MAVDPSGVDVTMFPGAVPFADLRAVAREMDSRLVTGVEPEVHPLMTSAEEVATGAAEDEVEVGAVEDEVDEAVGMGMDEVVGAT